MAVITDKNKINEALDRGVARIYPDKQKFFELLASGKKIRLYCGFDPSASALHIGNAIQINKLGQFQDLGHEVIFLIGDFTGMIGDPTDKLATRKKLSREEVSANAKNYQQQAAAYLRFDGENPAVIKYNSEWNDRLPFRDLIEVCSNFTVQQMIQRDMFQERIKEEKPIHLHEFLYPVAQGYDSLVMEVDLEVGGNDQMFNMMCGRDLLQAVKGREKFVLTTKLLADGSGKKMGKSEGNVVFLNEEPAEMYGKIMSWSDEVIIAGFELCSKLPLDEVREMSRQLIDGEAHPRDLKMKLALAITEINHGKESAEAAQERFVKTIQKKELPEEIPFHHLERKEWRLAELLVAVNLAASKGDARRLIKQGGIKLNNQVETDFNKQVAITNEGVLIQKGKRFFVQAVN